MLIRSAYGAWYRGGGGGRGSLNPRLGFPCVRLSRLVEQAGFPEEWMSETFSHMTFGSGIVAILSGIVASFVRDAITVLCVFVCVLLVLE